MELLYLDESGSTGLDLDNKHQPYFVLAGVSVKDDKWHKVNDYFEQSRLCSYLQPNQNFLPISDKPTLPKHCSHLE